jgi:hypothetical protein
LKLIDDQTRAVFAPKTLEILLAISARDR